MKTAPEKEYQIVKGRYGALYHVEKNPDFSRILWADDTISSNTNEIGPGKMAFQFLVDLLRLSGIKTDAKIEYGNLKSKECRADYRGAHLNMPGRDLDINFYKRVLNSGYSRRVQIAYMNFLLPRNSNDITQMHPRAKELSERICENVMEANQEYDLNCRYYPCMEIRASIERDVAVSIWMDELQLINGKLPKFDRYAELLGEVDKMILENFGHQIQKPKK